MLLDRQSARSDRKGSLTIATVMEPDAEHIARAIAESESLGADAVEVRFDAAPGIAPDRIAAPRALPMIATCRPRAQGGRFAGSEAERASLLEGAARTGRFLLDLEHGTEAAAHLEEKGITCAVLSHHESGPENGDRGERLRAMLDAAGADTIVKYVTTAARAEDALVCRTLLREIADARLAAFAMGEAGRYSRVLAGVWGSSAIWASTRETKPGAPGQIDLHALLAIYRFRALGSATRIFGVAGRHSARSLSPVLHNAVFADLAWDAVYLPLETETPDELASLAASLPLSGISITHPLKVSAMSLARQVDPLARHIGACNTLYRDPEESAAPRARERTGSADISTGFTPRSAGYIAANTDAQALVATLQARLPLEGRRATVVGSGGAARAAAFALRDAGASITIAARNAAAGRDLAGAVQGRFVPIAAIASDPEAILVQATSAPIEDRVVPEAALDAAFVLDLRYGPTTPATVRAALEHGAPAADGLGMLVRQARAQARLFTGRDVSSACMSDALARAGRPLPPLW